jgi:hypothetical protein
VLDDAVVVAEAAVGRTAEGGGVGAVGPDPDPDEVGGRSCESAPEVRVPGRRAIRVDVAGMEALGGTRSLARASRNQSRSGSTLRV